MAFPPTHWMAYEVTRINRCFESVSLLFSPVGGNLTSVLGQLASCLKLMAKRMLCQGSHLQNLYSLARQPQVGNLPSLDLSLNLVRLGRMKMHSCTETPNIYTTDTEMSSLRHSCYVLIFF